MKEKLTAYPQSIGSQPEKGKKNIHKVNFILLNSVTKFQNPISNFNLIQMMNKIYFLIR